MFKYEAHLCCAFYVHKSKTSLYRENIYNELVLMSLYYLIILLYLFRIQFCRMEVLRSSVAADFLGPPTVRALIKFINEHSFLIGLIRILFCLV